MAEEVGKGKRGPKTAAGKAAVRLNPLKHGVLSQTPVIPLVEREGDWERLRSGIFRYFGVVGMMEEALADIIAMLVWRRYRLVRFETEAIARYLEEVPLDYGRKLAAEGASPEVLTAEAVAEMDRMVSARLMPGAETAEKIMRYETRMHRFLLQTIHQLLVLQALRRSNMQSGKQANIPAFPEDGQYFPNRCGGEGRGRGRCGGRRGLSTDCLRRNGLTDAPRTRWREWLVMRKRRRTRGEWRSRDFYGRCFTAKVDGNGGDEAELRRQARDVLYTQPEDRGLVIRSSRVWREEGKRRSKVDELTEALERMHRNLGEQLLPVPRNG